MRLLSAEALLLDVVDLHDSDRIVTFVTKEWGKKRGVARGARRKFSRYAGQLQPLAKVMISWFEKNDRELVRVREVQVIRSAHRLQTDLEDILLGSYLAEHLVEFAQENEASDKLFRLLDTTVEALLAGVDRNLAARYFESWVLRLGGIFPSPVQCPECNEALVPGQVVLPESGLTFVCRRCSVSSGTLLVVEESTLVFLQRIGHENLDAMQNRRPSESTLRQVEEICGRIRRQFLGRELRSYGVMQQTLLMVR